MSRSKTESGIEKIYDTRPMSTLTQTKNIIWKCLGFDRCSLIMAAMFFSQEVFSNKGLLLFIVLDLKLTYVLR